MVLAKSNNQLFWIPIDIYNIIVFVIVGYELLAAKCGFIQYRALATLLFSCAVMTAAGHAIALDNHWILVNYFSMSLAVLSIIQVISIKSANK